MRLSVAPRRIPILLVTLAMAIIIGAYIERKTIARRFADAELAARKVDARYEITAIGPRTQRLENVVLGDPRNPDLTADWAEIRIGLGLSGVGVRSVRAGGVRLRGRWVDGKLSFGAVDRLLPAPAGEPIALPDIDLALNDARLTLETGYGAIEVRIEGKGNLASGFVGTLLADAARIEAGAMQATSVSAQIAVATRRRRIEFSGPLSAGGLLLTGNALRNASVQVKGSAGEPFTSVTASWAMTAAVEKLRYGAARQVRGDGRFDLDGNSQRVTAKLELDGARPGPSDQARLASAIPSATGTPAEPLLRQFRMALARLGQGSVATLPVEYRSDEGQRSLLVGPPTLLSLSGARLVGSGRGLVMPLDRGQPTFDGEFALSGGSFPAGTIRLELMDGNWTGNARFRPYRVGNAQIALTPVSLRYSKAGLSLATVAMIDGPLGGGRVTGFRVPVTLRPGRDPLAWCFTPGFRSLDIAGLHLAPASLNTCIVGTEARIASPLLAGRFGDTPIQIAANSARIGFSRGDFAMNGIAIRLGGAERRSRLDMESLSGAFGKGSARGLFSGTSGEIGNVPLKVFQGRGDWEFASGVLGLKGSVRVADSMVDSRFNPLVSDDFSLRLADNRITAHGTAREPKSRMPVADVRIDHDLGSGTGSATLDVADLVFGKKLQPEMLTNTTLGVIANVVGSIAGQGIIRWTPDGATSSGSFRTDNLDLAAAFGPVTGLKGEIALSDLLGLETGPGQTVSIASINPGIAVLEGNIRYQLLPGQKVRIEGGRWPFAGGWLILEPTMFDLTEAAERRLTFRVEGLDAGQFINQLQFENIDATGIYDGTLPMIFDQQGGRIEGGRLVARGGGTLAYVGEISNENLGTMGRVAFDALKSIRYDRLSIDLVGPLDGDVVTRISFAGVNQAPISGVRAKLPIPIRVTGLTNFPFIFNVTITAPFRKLFDMSRTISDPSLLIERLNPDLQRIGPAKTIQPPESETVR